MKKSEKIEAFKKLREGLKNPKFNGDAANRDTWNGLCHIINDKVFSRTEYWYLKEEIGKVDHMPFSPYCWKPGAKRPRIKWINEQIKQLEKV